MREGLELRFWRSAPMALWRLIGSFESSGAEHIPHSGAFLLLSNHQSVLDPFFIQAACPRALHPMTKSTQFASPGMRWLLPHFNAFPVRRYQIDPQAVRVVLRRLAAGNAVHIYGEGERSWDGRPQEPRPGTVRVALKAGVPVVPCSISGAYDAWPRWSRGVRRAHVRVTFGEPLHFARLDRRAEREAHRLDATKQIIDAIAKGLDSA
jgi:1-acyl-sn-glycerol-3-phosphate acyltransferase